MKVKFPHKLVNIVLILMMFSHTSFFHEYLQNYVLCFGIDGHIQIENVNECEECSKLDFFITNTLEQVIVQNLDCEDIPLDKHCFEENQFISQRNLISTIGIQLPVISFLSSGKKVLFYNLDFKSTINPTLENYKKVSLTI